MRPPSITILDAGASAELLREVCAGAEEQGVPVEVVITADADAAHALAYAAATRSRLQVGVGLHRDGTIAVHHTTLPEGSPALAVERDAQPSEWRTAGHVAARIVTRLPLTPTARIGH